MDRRSLCSLLWLIATLTAHCETEPTLPPDCSGCSSGEREVDEPLQGLFDQYGEELRKQAEHMAQAAGVNAIFVEFVPMRFRRQSVAGRNYFVKVRVADGMFADVLIYEPLKCMNASPEVEFVRFGVPEQAPIDPYWRPPMENFLQKPCRGCPTEEMQPDDRLMALIGRDGADLQAQALLAAQAQGMNIGAFEEFTPLRYKWQLVAGTRYFVKVRVMANEFMDVLIFESLRSSIDPRVVAVKVGADEHAPIDPYDNGYGWAMTV